ncbi:MAG: hypothetical protein Q8P53_02740 [Candidatus Shapirobacteria bacterium]|nr:hypothetical protein [Candidatus Shapirobacteria bacterium]
MIKITKYLLCVFLVSILMILSVKSVKASILFSDNFLDTSSFNNWNAIFGGGIDNGSWKIESSQLVGEITAYDNSYLISKNEICSDSCVLSLDSLNISGVDQSLIFRVSADKTYYYQVDFRYQDPYWSQDNNNIKLYKVNKNRYYELVNINPSNFGNSFELSQNTLHKIKIVLDSKNIKIYFDSILVIDYSDPSPYSYGRFGFRNWGGNYFYRSTKNIYDNFKVTSLSDFLFKRKIILIPGLGTSWNTRAIVYGENVADTDWKMIPFSKNYDSFTALLDKNGLIREEDYYVWNYDWRQPVGTIVNKLNNFIHTNVGSSETVDLVGHSLGGLVSRIWYQDHKNDARINKVITLGSPHTGSVDAYDAWNGMKFSDGPDLTNIAVNLLLQLKRKGLENNLSLVRGNMPIFKDLIPISSFIKKNKSLVSLDKLETKNTYLVNKNNSAVSLDKFKTYTGTGKSTKEFINIGDRNIFDKLLGIWPDGRPISYTSTDGDGTVLKKSARFETGTTDFYTLKSNHSSIIDNSLDILKTDLNLTEAFTSITDENLAGNMVIFIGSPVDASLRCGDSSPIVAQDGFILVKKELNKNCILNLDGTGNGEYHLVLGDVDNSDNWYYHEDTVEVGQNIKFNLNLSINAPDYASQNPSFLYQQIKDDVELLTTNHGSNKYLTDALIAVDLKDNNKILDNVFGFRKLKKESEISGRILNNLEMLLVTDNKSVSQNVAMNTYKKALQNKSTVDRMTGIYLKRGIMPSSFSSLSYQSLENQITKLKKNKKNKNYPLMMAESKLVSKYATEIW